MTRIVLDAGALIALERNDRELWAAIKLASQRGEDVLVPSTALAQVWRGTATQALLALALQHCVQVDLSRPTARGAAPGGARREHSLGASSSWPHSSATEREGGHVATDFARHRTGSG